MRENLSFLRSFTTQDPDLITLAQLFTVPCRSIQLHFAKVTRQLLLKSLLAQGVSFYRVRKKVKAIICSISQTRSLAHHYQILKLKFYSTLHSKLAGHQNQLRGLELELITILCPAAMHIGWLKAHLGGNSSNMGRIHFKSHPDLQHSIVSGIALPDT